MSLGSSDGSDSALYASFINRARELGTTVTPIDSAGDAQRQSAQLAEIAQQQPQAIAIQPLDAPATQATMQRAAAAGVHVFGFGESLAYDELEMLVYENTLAEGELSARYIGQKLGGHGTVALVGSIKTPLAELRIEAASRVFRDELPNLTMLPREDVDVTSVLTTETKAGQRLGASLLAAHPDLAAAWCVNDAVAAGVGEAARTTGRSIVVTGIGGTEQGVSGVEGGQITATWDPRLDQVGANAAEDAINILQGRTPKWQLPQRVTSDPVRRERASNA
ncbi:MAG TPA: substrate-binding domain-containing protein [Chloroflexota bacterium]